MKMTLAKSRRMMVSFHLVEARHTTILGIMKMVSVK